MEIRLLGMRAAHDGVPLNNRILLFLAAHHPDPVRRSDLAQALWPGDAAAEVGNRLRVGLARLRKSGRIDEVDEWVQLTGTTDIARIQQELQDLAEEPDPEQERIELQMLLPKLAMPVVADETEEWLEPIRQRWALLAVDGATRLAHLAEARRQPEVALEACAAGLAHLPHDETLWTLQLRCLRLLGRQSEAQRAFAQVRKQLTAEGTDFSEQLVALAEDLAHAPIDLTPTEFDILGRFFRRCLDEEPDVALQLLASSSFRPEVVRRPAETIDWLRSVLVRSEVQGEARERCQVRIITALGQLERDEEVISESESFLSGDVQPARRRIALLNRSFALFVRGRHEEAMAAALEAAEIADATGWPYDAWQCRCQAATFQALQLDLMPALATFREGLRFFEEAPDAGALQDALSIRGNYGYACYLAGDVVEAERVLMEVDQAARRSGFSAVESIVAPWVGLLQAQLGRARAARGALARGLRVSYRQAGTRRVIKALMDTADALELLGRPEAALVRRDWATLFASSGHEACRVQDVALAKPMADPREVPLDLLDSVRFALSALRLIEID